MFQGTVSHSLIHNQVNGKQRLQRLQPKIAAVFREVSSEAQKKKKKDWAKNEKLAAKPSAAANLVLKIPLP